MHSSFRRDLRLLAICALAAPTMFSASEARAAFYNGPYLQQVRESSVLLMWETDSESTATIQYGTAPTYGQSISVTERATLHSVELTNLAANTMYYYAVKDAAGETRTGTFFTAPTPGTDFVFAAYGDNRSNPEDHLAVASGVLRHSPRLVVTTGDYVEDAPILQQWHDQFFVPAAELLAKTPILPAIGNHESEMGHPNTPVWDYFPRPSENNYYSWDYGDIHFVVVDSNQRYGKLSAQYAWLESDLAATTRPVIIVLHHYPVYSSGNHGSAPMMDSTLRPLYEQYGVTAVLNGHDHMYERSVRNGISYFVLGGGGAGLYDPGDNPNPYAVISEKSHNFGIFNWSNDKLTLTAYRTDGSVIETLVLHGEGAAPRVVTDGLAEADGAAEEDMATAGCGMSSAQQGYAAGGSLLSLLLLGGLGLARRRKS